MSNDDDDYESDEYASSEDSTEKEYNEDLRKKAGNLKQKRMAARPSTIVQVSTGPLEFHLQSMKKQLKAHAALINHPPFLDDLMIEVNKICGLVRKVEHCQLDINNVREASIVAKHSSPLSHESSPSSGAGLTQLYKDLEIVRAVVRRIDVHQAVDATVLVRVKKLATNLKTLKGKVEKMYGNNFRVIQDEMKGEIQSVNTRMQLRDDLHDNKFEEVFARIQKTEDNIHEGQKEDTERIAKKVEFLEQNLTTDFYSFKEQMDCEMVGTKKKATSAFIRASRESLGAALQLADDCCRERVLSVLRMRFVKWRNFDPHGVLSRGRELISLTRRVVCKMLIRSALHEWKCHHEKQKQRERMRIHMTNIVHKWKEVAFPTMARRFHTWKRYCVLMNFHELEREASRRPLPAANPSEQKEKYANAQFERLMGTMNPGRDIEGSFQLTGLYVDRIFTKIERLRDDVKTNSDAARRIGCRVDVAKTDLTGKLDKRCGEVETLQKNHSKLLNSKMRDMKVAQEEIDKSTADKIAQTDENVSRLETAVLDLSSQMEDQSSRLERLFALHQKMLNRMDAIETTQTSHDSQLSKINSLATRVSVENSTAATELLTLKQSTEHSMSGLREDINEIQSSSLDCSEKLQAVLSNQAMSHAAVSNLTKDFKSKISSIESWLNVTAPKPPSPKLLVALALKFEDKAVEKHCKDPAHTFSVSMTTDLAKDIATCAHWLVYHVVEATDVDVLTRVMKGPQDMATVYDQHDPSNSLHPDSPKDTTTASKYVKTTPLTHEEFCATTRESMLLRYLEKFQKQLRQSREEGVVRREARALFLKRFIDSLDLSLQKQDAIVLATPSAMGRGSEGHASPACVACDRPLRMRTTSRSIGELYDKLLITGKKSSDVKREVLRSQILSPQNRPTSPVHSYHLESQRNNSDNGFSSRIDDIQHKNTEDSERVGRKGQSVVRIRPASSSSRPKSAKDLMTSHSATQLSAPSSKKTPHVHSPSKGGGFKSAKSMSQQALAASIAGALPLEATIPPRHSMDPLQPSSATRQLMGKFQEQQEPRQEEVEQLHVPEQEGQDQEQEQERQEQQEAEAEEAEGSVQVLSRGLRGSFVQSVTVRSRTTSKEE